jgi:hypothetical protein
MNKTMLAAALAAIAIGSASAETIYITGSTAFRGAANTKINDYITGTLSGSLVAKDNATLTKAGNLVWKAGDNYYVAAWSGSEAGIQSVAGPVSSVYAQVSTTNTLSYAANGNSTNQPVSWTNGTITHSGSGTSTVWKQVLTNNGTLLQAPNTITFWDSTQTFSTNSDGTPNTNVMIGGPTTVKKKADIAFADTYQASSAFGSAQKIAYYTTNNIPAGVINTNSPAPYTNAYVGVSNDTIVGGVGFAFIVSPNYAYASGTSSNAVFANSLSPVIANITTALAKKLYTNGLLNAAELSGGLSDTNVNVYAVGRNIDSGTRVIAQAQMGISSLIKAAGVNSGVKQYVVLQTNAVQKNSDGSVYASNSSTTTILLTNWNAELVNGKLSAAGNGGYKSGGDLCTAIATATNLPAGTVLIGYAGINDAVGANAPLLSLNGVFPSVSAIKSGYYPFWSYEHVMVAPSASSNAVTFASNVASVIRGLNDSDLAGFAKGLVSLGSLTNTNIISRVTGTDGGTVSKPWTNSASSLPNW